VCLPVAPDGVLSHWKKHLPENAASEKYAKQMPSGFTYFDCHSMVLSTKKFIKFFQHLRAARSGSVKSNR